MARLSRIVVPHLPHHVTQRGNRREKVFFSDEDYTAYVALLTAATRRAETQVWAWCLMPDHVHLILVPGDEHGLRRSLADAHRRYARHVNARNQWTGHLWQGRYASVVMDEAHLCQAVRYVSLNPVRAGLTQNPRQWKWSSVHAHLTGKNDGLTKVAPVLERVGDFNAFLNADHDDDEFEPLRRAEIVGRPLGSNDFLEDLERRLNRRLRPRKRGPKPRSER